MICKQLGVRRENVGDVRDPRRVLLDGRVRDLELLLDRMEGDPDADGFVVLGQDLVAQAAPPSAP